MGFAFAIHGVERASREGGDTTKETTCSGDWASLKGARLRRAAAIAASDLEGRPAGWSLRLLIVYLWVQYISSRINCRATTRCSHPYEGEC